MDMKVKLSLLWIFVMLNYIYADILTLMDGIFGESSDVSEFVLTQPMLFAASVLMEIGIAMVILSRLLPYTVNRWANIVAGTIKTLAVVGSLFVGSGPAPYYSFFAAIEIACTLYIVFIAWNWVEESI